jgi:large subunit ribosomal protein L3
MKALIGKKLGMTQVFDENGRRIPVTVIEAGPCVVVQRKTVDKDGYEAVQLGFGEQKEQRVSRAALGRFKKAGSGVKSVLKEFRVGQDEELKTGDTVTAGIFGDVKYLDVAGYTKGRGFAGVVRRHRMAGGRMTHGGHSKRRVGSVGQCSYPARIAKNQRMPGHMGNRKIVQQNLELVAVREDDNLILVRGAVPGANGSIVWVREALKKAGKA